MECLFRAAKRKRQARQWERAEKGRQRRTRLSGLRQFVRDHPPCLAPLAYGREGYRMPATLRGGSVSCTGLLHGLTVPLNDHEERMSPSKQAERPPQHQSRQPGLEKDMTPRPRTESDEHIGSGKLDSKVALITGGDSGIGRAVAVAYAKEGADTAVVYLNEHDDAR